MTRRMLTLVILLLLAGCTDLGGRQRRPPPRPIYGPTWPHAVCDAVASCWPVDGPPR